LVERVLAVHKESRMDGENIKYSELMDQLANQLSADPKLVFRFFFVFSRFEYALKRAGFFKRDRKPAEADWKTFGKHLDDLLAATTEAKFKRAYLYLVEGEPLKRQVVAGSNNALRWEAACKGCGESEGEYLLRLVCTVRNTLFHGGKYAAPDGSFDDPARNNRLLESCLIILKQCLSLDAHVREFFEDAEVQPS
jgi:hypothetical protein